MNSELQEYITANNIKSLINENSELKTQVKDLTTKNSELQQYDTKNKIRSLVNLNN